MISKRFSACLLLCFASCLAHAQSQENTTELPSAPGIADIQPVETTASASQPPGSSSVNFTIGAVVDPLPFRLDPGPPEPALQSQTSRSTPTHAEPFHWKGLLLQSTAFQLLEAGTRIVTADQADRHDLLNKPYWSDYWASLGQFNMRRWNDGDNFKVNYIGHPMQGAISGYIERQNDPRSRATIISRDRAYWTGVVRAFLWATAYSTESEIGPLGEAAIFNEGGYTYPINCVKNSAAPGGCNNPRAENTNNTGWVDFIITPVVGTLWLIGEDTIDRYVTDPLVANHPGFGYKVLRSSLNPPRSLANMLRGRYPWYRDYEHPSEYQSPVVVRFEEALAAEPHETVDLHFFYSDLSLRTNHTGCFGCRTSTSGGGVEAGYRVRKYLDLITTIRVQPNASPVSSLNIGGNLLTANFGIRSGYSGQHFALKASLSPGFASYSDTIPPVTPANPVPNEGRNFNFNAVAALSGDIRFSSHFAVRATVEQMLIRYKSPDRDPPGIGTEPRISFLSHDNYINSTNWGVRVGPVLRF